MKAAPAWAFAAPGSVALSKPGPAGAKSELLWEQPGLELCLQPLPPSPRHERLFAIHTPFRGAAWP